MIGKVCCCILHIRCVLKGDCQFFGIQIAADKFSFWISLFMNMLCVPYARNRQMRYFCLYLLSILHLCIQVALLEWTDDLELFILKGYGKSLNYLMGLPLLKDVVESMESAIKANEGDVHIFTFAFYPLYRFYCTYLLQAGTDNSIFFPFFWGTYINRF